MNEILKPKNLLQFKSWKRKESQEDCNKEVVETQTFLKKRDHIKHFDFYDEKLFSVDKFVIKDSPNSINEVSNMSHCSVVSPMSSKMNDTSHIFFLDNEDATISKKSIFDDEYEPPLKKKNSNALNIPKSLFSNQNHS